MTPVGPLRHQLASSSPITAGALARASVPGRGSVAELRAAVTQAYGVSDAVLLGSGTEALYGALVAAEAAVGEEGPVALPAFNCYDVASAAVRFGRPIAFYDVEPWTLGPDPESLQAALRTGARVVVLASLYGIPLDWAALDPLLSEAGAVVVEDAAQGHGALWRGSRLGGRGRFGVLSFGRGKGWTGGSGGALLVRDEADVQPTRDLGIDQAPPARAAPTLAKAAAQWLLGRPSLYGLPRAVPQLGLGETHYTELGTPSGLSDAASSIVLATRDAAEREIPVRRANALAYASAVARSAVDVRLVAVPEGGTAGYIRFPLVAPSGLESFSSRDEAVRLGAARAFPRPLPELEAVAPLIGSVEPGAYPGATALSAELVTLPTHGMTTERGRARLVGLLSGPSRPAR